MHWKLLDKGIKRGVKMRKKVSAIILMLAIGIISFIGGTHMNTKHHLNMKTVVGFDTTENGLMLYTNDGNGYYLEK